MTRGLNTGRRPAVARMTSPPAVPVHRPRVWDVAWEGTPSWETGRVQPVVRRLLAEGAIEGNVLDVGCGSGRHAVAIAAGGHHVTGLDIAAAAIERARQHAHEADVGGRVTFEVADALELGARTSTRRAPFDAGPFDTALDVGLFHVLQPAERARYAEGLAAAVRAGGRGIVVAWSDRNPFGLGPGRIRRRDLRGAFTRATGWHVDTIEETRLESGLLPAGAHAWLARLTRR